MKKMKIIMTLCLLVLFNLFVFGSELKAITEDGETVLLKDDGTWKTVATITKSAGELVVPPEPTLFNYALKELSLAMIDHYLDHYEGLNLKNTITLIYHKARMVSSYDPEYKQLLIKGIQYTEKYGKAFEVQFHNTISMESNLSFYWYLANALEHEKKYAESLEYYEKLKELHQNTSGRFKYYVLGENNIEELDGKIYTLKFLLASSV